MILTSLYVPGDRPDRFEKAAASGAHTVIVDLEDAVAPDRKPVARDAAARWLSTRPADPVELRINAPGSEWFEADLAVARELAGLSGVRVPKVESGRQVRDVVHGLSSTTGVGVRCLIESAVGVESAYEIARAHPQVASIGLGEADLSSDLGVTDEAGLAWARSRVVVAARAAGLRPPMMSVYPHVDDLDGLAASCLRGRELGFVGRVAIHPRQLSTIVDGFRPSASAVADAEAVLAAVAEGRSTGRGVVVLPDGRMLDPAMVGSAERVIALAASARGPA